MKEKSDKIFLSKKNKTKKHLQKSVKAFWFKLDNVNVVFECQNDNR